MIDFDVSKVVDSVRNSEVAYCKFITANDTGDTGGHQAGYHLHKNSWPLFFEAPGAKGSNKDRFVRIRWQDDFETSSRFIYYGIGTRNEYRLTRFGRGFPYLSPDNVGDLLVISKRASDYYEAFVLQTEESIENFLTSFGLSPSETNRIIPKVHEGIAEDALLKCFAVFLATIRDSFPATETVAASARDCHMRSKGITSETIRQNPDLELINWVNAEYNLFQEIERRLYETRLKSPFQSVQELVQFANAVLNRRKSRAGKSLEHHLAEIFHVFAISFSSQAVTEGRNRPDFIFPSIKNYHDPTFNAKRLVFLACKTTCKDRWRQILSEGDKIKQKHLFTLQQGISKNQLVEMYKNNVRLVVPSMFIGTFPKDFQPKIMSLKDFVSSLLSQVKMD